MLQGGVACEPDGCLQSVVLASCRFLCVTGLLYDKVTGYLMKVNSLNHIQLDTVHFGLRKVGVDEILKAYGILKVRKRPLSS
jgi:hypothetical protein